MSAKDRLHGLVDLLPENHCGAAERFLQFLVDDAGNEPLSEEDWREVRQGEAAIARGEFTTLEDLKPSWICELPAHRSRPSQKEAATFG